ncbi:metallophosphoesterase [Paenibacillus sp. S150]|uniref:metallophosphoesterase family protein n=1 Tax=Paenibacillus sp. S150 TaxID=2749826 RepID=UPI001C58E847|nr:metallophosphoesterase family protein [Paenibacillus sp. S150]MBW4082418.1 metallophosphoesterase family protein [Paenibacillus sp. S150]
MIRIAVISDVHGNRLALEAVLEDIRHRRVDQIVNLGDVLYGPLDPLGTAALLIDQKIITIMGNCDEILQEEHSDEDTFKFVKPLLTGEIMEWISGFLPTWSYENLLFCHGTPGSNHTYLLEEITPHNKRLKSPASLQEELSAYQEHIVICGHSHMERTVILPDGKIIVNAGSVGLPAYDDPFPFPHQMESGTPHAKYALLSHSEGGWNIEHIKVSYDWFTTAALARSNGREDYAVAIESGKM